MRKKYWEMKRKNHNVTLSLDKGDKQQQVKAHTFYLILHFGKTLDHTVLIVAALRAGLPHKYTSDVHTALQRAKMAKGLVVSLGKVSPRPISNLRIMLTKEGPHSNRKIITTKMIILSDSFWFSFSALGGPLSIWYLTIIKSFIFKTSLVSTITCKLTILKTNTCICLENGKKIITTDWT